MPSLESSTIYNHIHAQVLYKLYVRGTCTSDRSMIHTKKMRKLVFLYTLVIAYTCTCMCISIQWLYVPPLEDNYSNVVYEFYNIHNIHVMRESLQRVLEGTSLGFN